LLEVVAIEEVVGVEGNETLRVGVRDVDAGLLDRAEIEALRVDELHDEDAEEVGVAEVGRGDLRETAEEIVQRGGLRLRRVVGLKSLKMAS
jgi:hypothetical protein